MKRVAHYNQNSQSSSLKLPKTILSTTVNSQQSTVNYTPNIKYHVNYTKHLTANFFHNNLSFSLNNASRTGNREKRREKNEKNNIYFHCSLLTVHLKLAGSNEQ
jgi:hypothetical protein